MNAPTLGPTEQRPIRAADPDKRSQRDQPGTRSGQEASRENTEQQDDDEGRNIYDSHGADGSPHSRLAVDPRTPRNVPFGDISPDV